MRPFELFQDYVCRLCSSALSGTDLSITVPPQFNTMDRIFLGYNRTIRPDILIKRDADTIAVIDAKRRNFQSLTNVGGAYTLDQESLYRMLFYVNFYRKQGHEINGVFVVPNLRGSPLFEQATISYDSKIHITLLGININTEHTNYESNSIDNEGKFKKTFREILGIDSDGNQLSQT
ncbi:MAG: hypothetical protein HQM04_08475 [Magnetococcales bacterium]|nr:hypothetical protein [Magnetococcales bacterium]MBF0115067.1 hypothetical protein [Magnetococcales bacterium]